VGLSFKFCIFERKFSDNKAFSDNFSDKLLTFHNVAVVVARPPDPGASAGPQRRKPNSEIKGGECRRTLQPHRLDAAVGSTT